MKTALLVIDVQRALCEGEYAAFDIEGVIDRINLVSRKARAAGVPVIVIQHEESGGPLEQGSDAWQLARGLEVEPTDILVRKKTPDSFHQTELQPVLQSLGVTGLIVCGLQSEYCVDSTTRGALARGYPVTLVADAHTTLDNEVISAAQISAHHNTTLSRMDSYGARVTLAKAGELRVEA
jgi:nicotinamidase-related amidase